jgi:hypothetical protein
MKREMNFYFYFFIIQYIVGGRRNLNLGSHFKGKQTVPIELRMHRCISSWKIRALCYDSITLALSFNLCWIRRDAN